VCGALSSGAVILHYVLDAADSFPLHQTSYYAQGKKAAVSKLLVADEEEHYKWGATHTQIQIQKQAPQQKGL
jgi:hypothetical protein